MSSFAAIPIDVTLGDTIYYVEGNKEALRRRAAAVARDAMVNGRIKVKDVAGGLHIYCAGAAVTLGFKDEGEVRGMIDEVRRAMRQAPSLAASPPPSRAAFRGMGYLTAIS